MREYYMAGPISPSIGRRFSKTESRRKLKTPGTKSWDDGQWGAKMGVRSRRPSAVRPVCSGLSERILHIVHRVLLEISTVEEIEGLRGEFGPIPFSKTKLAGNAEIDVLHIRPAKRIETLTRDN